MAKESGSKSLEDVHVYVRPKSCVGCVCLCVCVCARETASVDVWIDSLVVIVF